MMVANVAEEGHKGMNIGNIMKLADFIGSGQEGRDFDMGLILAITDDQDFEDPGRCRTVGCIAGYARFLMELRHTSESRAILKIATEGEVESHLTAADWLGIDGDLAVELFCPKRDHAHIQAGKDEEGHISSSDAVLALQRLAAGYGEDTLWDFKRREENE